MTVFEKIYEVVKTIPRGRVMTYGQVALLAGNPRWARVVGYALHNNPSPETIPCHRVVNREGRVTGAFKPEPDFGARFFLRILSKYSQIRKYLLRFIPPPPKKPFATKFFDLSGAIFCGDFGEEEHIRLSPMCDDEPKAP